MRPYSIHFIVYYGFLCICFNVCFNTLTTTITTTTTTTVKKKSIELKLNIALHAQVKPSNDKIVGSVITTDGILSALQKRNNDINIVKVFYPSYYESYLNHIWDLVLIEGWFPSMSTFLLLTRNHFPLIKIIFICLDPSYPRLDLIRSFDVDGILTNSLRLKNEFNNIIIYNDNNNDNNRHHNNDNNHHHNNYNNHHYNNDDNHHHKHHHNNYNNDNKYNHHHNKPMITTDYLLLAANTIEFHPYINASRRWGAVYVGAGGYMLSHKPELLQLLLDAVPFGLRLHGTQWNTVPILSNLSKGPLPRYELAEAYSSAHVVLASTIQTQDDYGMINNRIFEALSCGAIVITKYSQALADLNCDAILFVNSSLSLAYHLEAVIRNENNYATNLRLLARNFILNKHTWSHRVIQIIDFYYVLRLNDHHHHHVCLDHDHDQRVCRRTQCLRVNCPNLLWIVSSKLLNHPDYIFAVRDNSEEYLSSMYTIHFITEEDFYSSVKRSCNLRSPTAVLPCNNNHSSTHMRISNGICHQFLSSYDVIFVVTTFFDDLDMLLSVLPTIRLSTTQLLQKRISYVIGYDPVLINKFMKNTTTTTTKDKVSMKYEHNHYDVILYRSPFELSLYHEAGIMFKSDRLQHAFGLGVSTQDGSLKHHHRSIVIVCFYSYLYLCKASIIASNYARARATLLKKDHHVLLTGEAQLDRSTDDDDDDDAKILLLIGGIWQDWLDTDEDFVLYEVIHVREGKTGIAVAIIQQAALMVLMLDNTGLGQFSTCNNAHSSWKQSLDYDHDYEHGHVIDCHITNAIDTSRNILWPFVAAANAYTRIFLYVYNEHYQQLNNVGCSEWSEDMFRTVMLKTAFDRLIGLGSIRSAVMFTQLTAMSKHSDDWKCFSSVCDNSDMLFVESYNTHTSTTASTSSPSSSSSSSSINSGYTILLKVEYKNYIVGQDGYLCIEYRDEVICLLRSFDYICLYVTLLQDSSYVSVAEQNNNNSQIEDANDRRCQQSSKDWNKLSIQLKGLFYGDIFYSDKVTVDLSHEDTNDLSVASDNNTIHDTSNSHYEWIIHQTIITVDDHPKMTWMRARDDLYVLPISLSIPTC